MRKENMILITVHVPKAYIERLNILVEKGLFPSRSEAIRVAIRELIAKELYKNVEKRLMIG